MGEDMPVRGRSLDEWEGRHVERPAPPDEDMTPSKAIKETFRILEETLMAAFAPQQNVNTGGPAFPTNPYTEHDSDGNVTMRHLGDFGMDLRDYFAANAISEQAKSSVAIALFSLPDDEPQRAHAEKEAERGARAAYMIADAMLLIRQGK